MCDYFAQQRIIEGSSTPFEEGCTCQEPCEMEKEINKGEENAN